MFRLVLCLEKLKYDMKTKLFKPIGSITQGEPDGEINIRRGYFTEISNGKECAWDFSFKKLHQSTWTRHYYQLNSPSADFICLNWLRNQQFLLIQGRHFIQRKDDLQWLLNAILAVVGTIILLKQVFPNL